MDQNTTKSAGQPKPDISTEPGGMGSKPAKVAGISLLIGVTAFGLYQLVLLLKDGHSLLNATQFVPWGLWVVLYIFFLGISSGSFMVSALAYVFGVKQLQPVGPLALFLALVGLVLGGFFIMIDLGHPFKSYLIIVSLNPTSVMAWMGLFYASYVTVLLSMLYIVVKPIYARYAEKGKVYSFLQAMMGVDAEYIRSRSDDKEARTLKILGMVGIPVALLVTGGVGTIFALAKGRLAWNSGILPVIFLVSALVSGAAMLTFLTGILLKLPHERKRILMRGLAKLTMGLLALDVLIIFSEILVALYSESPHEMHSWTIILFGDTWWVFWFAQLGIGVILPLFILFLKRTRNSIAWLGLLGLSVVVGILGVRYNIVVPAQIVEPLEGITKSYHHFRFTIDYAPSLNEIAISLFGFALAIWGVWVGTKVLPLDQGVEEI